MRELDIITREGWLIGDGGSAGITPGGSGGIEGNGGLSVL